MLLGLLLGHHQESPFTLENDGLVAEVVPDGSSWRERYGLRLKDGSFAVVLDSLSSTTGPPTLERESKNALRVTARVGGRQWVRRISYHASLEAWRIETTVESQRAWSLATEYRADPNGKWSFSGERRLSTYADTWRPLVMRQGSGPSFAVWTDNETWRRHQPGEVGIDLSNEKDALYIGLRPGLEHRARESMGQIDRAPVTPPTVTFAYWIKTLPAGSLGLGRWISEATWNPRGVARLRIPLPQVVPFKYSTRPVYTLQEWDRQAVPLDGRVWWSRGNIGGAGTGAVSYGAKQNALRAAWAMGLWGERLGQPAWRNRASQALELWLSAESPAPAQYDPGTEAFSEQSDWEAGWASGHWAALWLQTRRDGLPDPRLTSRIEALVEKAERETVGSRPLFDFLAEAHRTDTLPEVLRERAQGALEKVRPGPDADLETRLAWRLALCESVGADSSAVEELADELVLKQSVWERPGKPADWFGSMGAALDRQPSDDRSLLLLRAGVATGRRDLFERGVASLRSALAVFRESAASLNGVRVEGDVPLNGVAVGAASLEQSPTYAGFDAGEGAMLALATYALERFGSVYIHPSGWSCGVDAVELSEAGDPLSLLVNNPRPYRGEFPVKLRRGPTSDEPVLARDPVAVSRIELGWDGGLLKLTAVPSAAAMRPGETTGVFRFLPAGPVVPARTGARGFEATMKLGNFRQGLVEFEGKIGSFPVRTRPSILRVSPEFELAVPAPVGWLRTGDLARVWYPVRGHASTGDDGQSELPNSGLKGKLTSAPFLATPSLLKFTLAGQGGTRLRLVDETEGGELWSASPSDKPTAKEIDLEPWAGRMVRLILEDESAEGWVELRDPVWTPRS
ncbi:MAG: hypothetical protein KF884_05380 [Fimbriimonadaceae bacterium]|nr:hypothetical protein [Fimbriimonadaceae bacterium]QYK59516.1 MAG: hypothetical protein KF884_05380 [Fimbriimonadaceae bacterium]